ncbi:MAG: ATPase [Gammaproteobacteria bacterium]|nr:ATPase [Gammaproteobacteria bacterium]
MSLDLSTLFILGSTYLLLLFGVAYITDRGWIPASIVQSPVVYVLALGVFASIWAYYTSIGNALESGYGFLANSIGVSLAFLFSPLLLKPLLELSRTYQLSSLADLMAFRYQSPWAGTVSTIVILVGVTPLLALQIRAVADTANLLTAEPSEALVAAGFCVLITLFAILFGTSRRAGRTRHDGLVMAIAFESLAKLVAYLAVGTFAVYGAFGGFEGMDQWLQSRPDLIAGLKQTEYFSTFHVSALLFFTATVAMPHMFYMTFNENNGQTSLAFASWALPLYFLLISLPVLPILWAGIQSGSDVQVEYFPVIIGVAYDYPMLTLIGYLGGLSAASGLIIVITLALSNMCLNHLILPVTQPSAKQNIYRWLAWRRRVLTTAIIWAGFLVHYLSENTTSVQAIGIVAFSAGLQFLPGIVAILYWPQANKKGFLTGLLSGVAIWLGFLLIPLFGNDPEITLTTINWSGIAALSLMINAVLFIGISLTSATSDKERNSADICALDTIRRRIRSGLVAKSPEEFVRSLSKPLGQKAANREVNQALKDLKIRYDDNRPSSLRLLRGRLEANLSGLLGPSIAGDIIDSYLPFSIVARHGSADLNVIESRIESYRSNLSGMAADLDNLRRYHRQVLLELPLGVCSLSTEDEIVMWNQALAEITGIDAGEAVGSQLQDLPNPWYELLQQFLRKDEHHTYKNNFQLNGQKKSVNLHKAYIDQSDPRELNHEGVVLLIEDISETEILEASLTHSERLASIGRLAAGVAHEIGNPITGIACLAQTIRDEYKGNELGQLAGQIIEQTNRTSKILQSLVNFAHAGASLGSYEKQIVNVYECMQETFTLISLDKKSKEIKISSQCDEGLNIFGDPQKLLQVMLNLVNNARDASAAGSEVSMAASQVDSQIKITVTDNGVGIPEAIRDRVFDPFFTTKEAGEGTGLGLSMVFSIVGDLGGEIDILSPHNKDLGTGTQVVLTFAGYFKPPAS